MTASPSRRPRAVSRIPPVDALDEPAVGEPRDRARVDHGIEDARVVAAAERDRLVEPEPEHQPLDGARLGVEVLDLARRRRAGGERLDVAPDGRQVPPSLARERRDGPTPTPR